MALRGNGVIGELILLMKTSCWQIKCAHVLLILIFTKYGLKIHSEIRKDNIFYNKYRTLPETFYFTILALFLKI